MLVACTRGLATHFGLGLKSRLVGSRCTTAVCRVEKRCLRLLQRCVDNLTWWRAIMGQLTVDVCALDVSIGICPPWDSARTSQLSSGPCARLNLRRLRFVVGCVRLAPPSLRAPAQRAGRCLR